MGAINFLQPGPGERERRLIFKGPLSLSISSALPFFPVLSFLQEKSMAPCHAFCGLLLPVVSLYEKRMKISWKKWKPCKRISILQQTLSIIASLYIKVNIFLKRNTGYACTISTPLWQIPLGCTAEETEFVDTESNSALRMFPCLYL